MYFSARRLRNWLQAIVCLAAIASPLSAMAANFSFTGTMPATTGIQYFTFSVAAPATVSLRAFVAHGGTNQAGTVIAGGSFDPVLSLFNDTTGAVLAANDDWFGLDSFIEIALPAGNYRVALTRFANFPVGPNLSDGFSYGTDPFGTPPWALDILGADAAAVVGSRNLRENLAFARSLITALPGNQVTGLAQRNIMTSMIDLATNYLGSPYQSLSANALNAVIARTNGCALRGSPDSVQQGAYEMDFVTQCAAQAQIYASLLEARTQLMAP